MERRLLKPEEAANVLGMSLAWINKGRIAGYGPRFLRIGRRIFYDAADIQRWLDERPRHQSTSEVAG
ncbi:helix-turn-helix transcriptional regulator [Azospirillum sp.]|uniref:helix-turn-helix transcriptional regulator n=1 Tax=Azospirillum sp. TaxID=34012 RepID=UPI0039C89CEE